MALQNFLLERHRAGQNTVLILDEAQNLYPQTLEQIRLLSNFETTKEKILQIVLVGQPELRARLELPELRQLKQRIGMLCSIPPMTPMATRNYIRTRLRMAGARDARHLHRRGAGADLPQFAGGIPRIVNTVCDHCLLIGYADQTRRIDRGYRRRRRSPISRRECARRYSGASAGPRAGGYRRAARPDLPAALGPDRRVRRHRGRRGRGGGDAPRSAAGGLRSPPACT